MDWVEHTAMTYILNEYNLALSLLQLLSDSVLTVRPTLAKFLVLNLTKIFNFIYDLNFFFAC